MIIPARNEAAHLSSSIQRIVAAVERATPSYEIILVDDGSSDSTWAEILRIASACPRLRGFRLARRYGKEAALSAGLEVCRGRAALTMDADLQHPVELIEQFYRVWKERRVQVVHGVKQDLGRDPIHRRLLSRGFNYVASRLSGVDLRSSADFKLLDRQVVDAWLTLPERRTFYRGMVAWLGFQAVEIPFTVEPRIQGRSQFGLGSLIRFGWYALTSYSYFPLRLIHILAAVFLAFSFILGSWALFLKFSGAAVSGFTTVIILQLMIGGALLLSLALIAEYLAAIYEEVKRRPRYVIAEIARPDQ
ncbi:MAG: glycosyltransferase family 2 protein [Bryobacteraceae bacterium]|nr:glycosyltransferase family 2 protein [Bryobacteraceae bacterium]